MRLASETFEPSTDPPLTKNQAIPSDDSSSGRARSPLFEREQADRRDWDTCAVAPFNVDAGNNDHLSIGEIDFLRKNL